MTEVELCQIIKGSNLFPGYKLHEEVGIAGVSCDMVYENGEKVFCIEAVCQALIDSWDNDKKLAEYESQKAAGALK